jgi:hypothetical protein
MQYCQRSIENQPLILKTRMEGPKIASFCSGVSICGSMGSHPEGPSRSDGIILMLSRLRRFDSLQGEGFVTMPVYHILARARVEPNCFNRHVREYTSIMA